MLGVDHKTVMYWLGPEGVEISTPESSTAIVTGADGKQYPANKPKPAVAVEMLPWLEREAKERQRQAAVIGGQTAGRGRLKTEDSHSQKFDEREKGKATEQAARLIGTNRQKEQAPEFSPTKKTFALLTQKTH